LRVDVELLERVDQDVEALGRHDAAEETEAQARGVRLAVALGERAVDALVLDQDLPLDPPLAERVAREPARGQPQVESLDRVLHVLATLRDLRAVARRAAAEERALPPRFPAVEEVDVLGHAV